jgi:hypothetical protein
MFLTARPVLPPVCVSFRVCGYRSYLEILTSPYSSLGLQRYVADSSVGIKNRVSGGAKDTALGATRQEFLKLKLVVITIVNDKETGKFARREAVLRIFFADFNASSLRARNSFLLQSLRDMPSMKNMPQ